MPRQFLAIMTCSTMVLLFACKTTYSITSAPPGAAILVDGRYFGKTPASVTYSNAWSRDVTCSASMSGYVDQIKTLGPEGGTVHFAFAPEKALTPEVMKSGRSLIDIIETSGGFEIRQSPVHAEEDVIERSPNVTAVRRVTDLADNRWLGRFNLSPDDQTVVIEVLDQELTTDDRKNTLTNLWSVSAEGGGGTQRVTQGNYFDSDPSFSRDAAHLYFSSNRAGTRSIWRLSVNSLGGLRLVTSGSTSDSLPESAPTGDRLLYTAKMRGSEILQLWTTPIGKGLPMQLREGFDGHWSPSGGLILFTAVDRTSGKTTIWTMRPDASSPTQISHSTGSNDITPRWSPNGSEIIFASDRGVASGKNNYDIWIMNADGSGPRQLTTNGSRDDQPIFSRDGATVYFRSNRGLKWDVWAMRIVEGL